jgi:hypothetical protein
MSHDGAARATFPYGKSQQTHDAAPGTVRAPGEYFCGDVFVIADKRPVGDLDDIDEFDYQPMPMASPVPLTAESLWPQLAVPGRDFPADMFMLDLNDIDDIDDFDDLPATARPDVLAPIAGAAGNRPGCLSPLTEFQTEMQPSPVYFSGQPAGYVFDEQVTADTCQLWTVLPEDFFWLIMGCAQNADIVSD